jgi:hypothetical protein
VREIDGVVFEGSASTFWDRGGFGKPTQLMASLLAPEALHRIVDQRTKLMVLLREPGDRLYSSYNHFGRVWRTIALKQNNSLCSATPTKCDAPDALGFHHLVLSELAAWHQCRLTRTELECAYATVEERHGSKYKHAFLAAGLYALYLDVWWR